MNVIQPARGRSTAKGSEMHHAFVSRRLVFGVVAGMLLLLGGPASAVRSFGPFEAVPTLGRGCSVGPVVAAASQVEGAAVCNDGQDGDRIAYAVRRNGAWTLKLLEQRGQPVALARDATGLYVLYRDAARSGAAAVLKRRQDGTVTARSLGRDGAVGLGAIVAYSGKWLAVWSAESGMGRNYALAEAGTLFGNQSPRLITGGQDSSDASPSLALRPQGGVALLWQRLRPQSADATDIDIRVAVRTQGSWRSRSVATGTETGPVSSNLVSDGRNLYGFWNLAAQPTVASDESGIFRSRRFVTRRCVTAGAIAASEGQVIAAYNQCLAGDARAPSGHAVTVLERRSGTWSSGPLYKSRDRIRETTGVVTSNGRAVVVFLDQKSQQSMSRAQ